ncbi:hypothetical protein [Agromyces sp. Marseille-P2726]|uniref:hypothetical protein n=1 Tax=Agromyces sp. Marseille-P2726 TaxID=2709132 RepID=UPI0015714175|nr:hypothetical protein [Agromyces sp. Marseille-P2726]
MAGFWVRHRRGVQELEGRDADVAKLAGSALVAADERLRLAAEEFAFAEAELGSEANVASAEAILAARGLLGEAFRLNRANRDAIHGTSQEVQARNDRIVVLCQQAESVLDGHIARLADVITRARHAPEVITGVRADVEHLRSRVPQARDIIDQLAVRYARSALTPVESNPAEAEQLLGFAEQSVRVAERRRDGGHREQANVALAASVDSVRRAAALLDAVEAFEVEALRAETMLAAVVEESCRDLEIALTEPSPMASRTRSSGCGRRSWTFHRLV